MVAIKKFTNKAYILLESLVGLALFAGIVSLVMASIQSSRRSYQEQLEQQEAFLVARMAMQTQQNTLTLNGKTVYIERDKQHIHVLYDGKELLHVEKR